MGEVVIEIPSVLASKRNEWKRKPCPIQLKTLSLQVVMEKLIEVNVANTSKEIKKLQRDKIKNEIPVEILIDLLELSKKSILKPNNFMSILEALPFTVYKRNIDFLGNYRGSNFCLRNNGFVWMNGIAAEFVVDLDTLKRLFTLLDEVEKSKIGNIALWTGHDVICSSQFPRIIANSTNLSSLTLRGDADDHILRIIGLNCVVLKYLDVSRSPKVTVKGLLNLVLKSRKSGNPVKALKNQITDSLCTFVATVEEGKLSNTDIALLGKFCAYAGYPYYIQPIIPESTLKIERTLVKLDMSLSECIDTKEKLFGDIETFVSLSIDQENLDAFTTDIFQTNSSEYITFVFNKQTKIVRLMAKATLDLGIIELSEHWENREWNLPEIINLADLTMKAPNLQKLNCRLAGSWDKSSGLILFPKLEEVNCWCIFDQSIRSLLKYAPCLRRINIRHVAHQDVFLTHADLVDILESKSGMNNCMEEFIVRPTKLTKNSLLEIHRLCPNIRRIGDLETWDCTNEDIDDVNKFLVSLNSQCVLVVMDYPPNI